MVNDGPINDGDCVEGVKNVNVVESVTVGIGVSAVTEEGVCNMSIELVLKNINVEDGCNVNVGVEGDTLDEERMNEDEGGAVIIDRDELGMGVVDTTSKTLVVGDTNIELGVDGDATLVVNTLDIVMVVSWKLTVSVGVTRLVSTELGNG